MSSGGKAIATTVHNPCSLGMFQIVPGVEVCVQWCVLLSGPRQSGLNVNSLPAPPVPPVAVHRPAPPLLLCQRVGRQCPVPMCFRLASQPVHFVSEPPFCARASVYLDHLH